MKKNDIMIVVVVAVLLVVGFFVWKGWQEAHENHVLQEKSETLESQE